MISFCFLLASLTFFEGVFVDGLFGFGILGSDLLDCDFAVEGRDAPDF